MQQNTGYTSLQATQTLNVALYIFHFNRGTAKPSLHHTSHPKNGIATCQFLANQVGHPTGINPDERKRRYVQPQPNLSQARTAPEYPLLLLRRPLLYNLSSYSLRGTSSSLRPLRLRIDLTSSLVRVPSFNGSSGMASQ